MHECTNAQVHDVFGRVHSCISCIRAFRAFVHFAHHLTNATFSPDAATSHAVR